MATHLLSCQSTLYSNTAHYRSMAAFQFLDPVDSLDGGSARRKASASLYRHDNTNTCLEWHWSPGFQRLNQRRLYSNNGCGARFDSWLTHVSEFPQVASMVITKTCPVHEPVPHWLFRLSSRFLTLSVGFCFSFHWHRSPLHTELVWGTPSRERERDVAVTVLGSGHCLYWLRLSVAFIGPSRKVLR
jgi:hypothetical protein